jgi:hypothetical protein
MTACSDKLKKRRYMMYKKIFRSVSVVLFIFAGLAIASPNVQEGLWEMTVKMELPSISMTLPPVVKKECLSKDKLIPKTGKVENCQECKISDVDIKGDTVKWHEECDSPEGKVIVDGEIVYNGDSYSGVINIKQGNMNIISKISGKRIGPCK